MPTKREPYRETRWLVLVTDDSEQDSVYAEFDTQEEAQDYVDYQHGHSLRVVKAELREVAG